MNVVEDHGILLIRGGSASNKDGHRVHVFKLSEFDDEHLKVRSRLDVRDRRIDKTRGCHLYTISKGGDGYLRMATAVGKKLITFQWRYTAAWTSWCPNNETEAVDGFIFLRVSTSNRFYFTHCLKIFEYLHFEKLGNILSRQSHYNDNTRRPSECQIWISYLHWFQVSVVDVNIFLTET